MLEKGTRRLNAQQISEAFDGWGAHIEISPGFDLSSISLYSLTKNWTAAFHLFVEMLQTPSFPDDELELMKTIFLQNLKVSMEKNSFVAGQLIRKNVFGENHPYGSSLAEADVPLIATSQLTGFHREAYQPFAVFVTAGSAFDEKVLIKSLSGFSATATKGSASRAIPGEKNDHVEKPESIQTAIRIGKRSVRRNETDYVPFLLLNHIFGGYFGSRLMKNIREEKGLTYGIYSSLQNFLNDSFWVIGADVNKENKELALEEIQKEMNTLCSQPIPQDELDVSRSHFLGSLQSEVANPFSVADKIKNIYLNKLPADFYQQLFISMRQLSARELMEVANRHFQNDSLHYVTVG
jgi:zinc protease